MDEKAVSKLTLYRFLYLIKELNMNKKLLCAALLSGLGVAQVAFAQDTTTTTTTTTTDAAPVAAASDFDSRWYVTGDIGYNYQDNSRARSLAQPGAALWRVVNARGHVDVSAA